MKLPIEIKTKWVAALRSGYYQQARNELYDGRGFCCLGVLAEVLEPGVTRTRSTIDGVGEGELYSCSSFRTGEEQGGIRPFAIRHNLGALFEPNEGLCSEARKDEIDLGDHREADRALMGFNDTGFGFDHIATLIEEHL